MERSLYAYVWFKSLMTSLAKADEAGEGVISTAIAVLIMAALGAAMWVGFQSLWNNTNERTTNQVNTIGGGGGAP